MQLNGSGEAEVLSIPSFCHPDLPVAYRIRSLPTLPGYPGRRFYHLPTDNEEQLTVLPRRGLDGPFLLF